MGWCLVVPVQEQPLSTIPGLISPEQASGQAIDTLGMRESLLRLILLHNAEDKTWCEGNIARGPVA
jgi:hypothetical protein